MDDLRIELFTPREKRAAAVFGIAAVILVVSVLAVIRPGSRPSSAQPPAATVPTPPPIPVASFTFVSPTTGFATTGTVKAGKSPAELDAYRTTDGARTWTRLSVPDGANGRPRYLQPLGGGWVLMGTGVTYDPGSRSYWLSGDSGSSWRRFPVPAGLQDSYLRLLDPSTGVLVSTPFYTFTGGTEMSIWWTHDRGRSWQETLHLDAVNPSAGALDTGSPFLLPTFTDDRHGWIMQGSFVPRPGVERPVLLRTSDAGQTWTEVALPAAPDRSFNLNTPVFPDGGRHGYLALSGSGGMFVYETQDGGDTWSDPYQTNVVWFSAAPDRWVTSRGLELLTSRDWGRTWSAQTATLPRPRLALGYVEPAGTALWAYSNPASRDFLFDRQPALMRSLDGGGTWLPARWPGL